MARLVHRGLGVRDFSFAAARLLGRAVAFDGACIVTVDPATGLPTGEVVVDHGLPGAARERLTEIEVREPDFTKFSALARSQRSVASLSEATGGDLGRSLRHRELKQPNGFGDELRAALVAESGTWGGLTLSLEAGRPPFSPGDTRLVASIARQLGEGLRRAVLCTALVAGDAGDTGDAPPGHEEPAVGLLLVGDDNSVEMADPVARMWLAELRSDDRPGTLLPPVVNAVASRARATAAATADGGGDSDSRVGGGDGTTGSMARARARTRSGRWLLVRGSVLGEGPTARTAVILEPARSPELAPLIADAYGLTDRERAVTELVARGHPTGEIADHLHLSPYTVQDHLKAIFDKVGVGTRGELVARLFFDHYAPRLSDGVPPGATGWFAR